MKNVPSTDCRSLLAPSKKLVVTTPTFWPTAGQEASMSGAVGPWTCSWARSDVMTEAEWLACTDPDKMLKFLYGKASDRKLRLFSVGCIRRGWHLIDDPNLRHGVETIQRFVDGCARDRDRGKARTTGVRVA